MLARAAKAGLTTWSEVETLDDAELDERLYGRKLESTRPLPNCAWIHTERSIKAMEEAKYSQCPRRVLNRKSSTGESLSKPRRSSV